MPLRGTPKPNTQNHKAGPTWKTRAEGAREAGYLPNIAARALRSGEVDAVGFDDDEWSFFLAPPLTTVGHSGWILGKHVGEVLLERLDQPDVPPKRTVLETELDVRGSTGPAFDSSTQA